MAQIRLLKIDATNGVPLEMDTAADDITLNSFTVQGGGPVMSGTGIDMNSNAVSDASSFQFTDPTTGFINQTAGNLVADDIMGKERENLMTTSGGISFPVISDAAGEVDSFRLPALAGAPTASPTTGGEGHLVWDSTNNYLYAWDGAAWENVSIADSAEAVDNSYTANGAISARDVVYISAADSVSPALADNTSASYALGFATAAAADTNPVTVRTDGFLDGFTGLTAGSRYYLDNTTPGAVSSSVPAGSGNTVVQVGYAKSTTSMAIQILQLGRRA